MPILPLNGPNNIYSYFENNDAPTTTDFINLIDTCIGTNGTQNFSTYTTVQQNSASWGRGSTGNIIFVTTVPTTSKGLPGDEEGMMAVDSDYIYYCFMNYDGVADIWKRVTLVDGPWG